MESSKGSTPEQPVDSQDQRPSGHSQSESQWSALKAEEINALPLRRFPGPIHVISNQSHARQILQEVRGSSLLGFDTETRPAFKKGTYFPPSLLQLATESEVFLFQIGQLGLLKGLRDLLADPDVLKVGVGLDYDVRELRKLARFKPAAFLDLADQARTNGLKRVSLRTLTATFLGFRISKGAKCSNWAVSDLKKSQIKYAATDAWVSREIYLFMAGRGMIDHSRGNSIGRRKTSKSKKAGGRKPTSKRTKAQGRSQSPKKASR
ncbi:MAG TPA: 3'-5' exonuclease [Acidobacteriota bacterium]|nr:3'-5' exonuclease [Acidobacteriota bacterium]